MNYLNFETKSLRSLVTGYTGGSFPWEQLGTTATAINLDVIDGGNMASLEGGKIGYLLPVMDESAANTFIVKIAQYGIEGTIMTEEEALAKWEEYKVIKASATEVATN